MTAHQREGGSPARDESPEERADRNMVELLQELRVLQTGIQILFGLNIINLTPDGVTITGTPNLNLAATAAITLTAPTVTINGAAATNVQSAGVCSVTAPLVKIN